MMVISSLRAFTATDIQETAQLLFLNLRKDFKFETKVFANLIQHLKYYFRMDSQEVPCLPLAKTILARN